MDSKEISSLEKQLSERIDQRNLLRHSEKMLTREIIRLRSTLSQHRSKARASLAIKLDAATKRIKEENKQHLEGRKNAISVLREKGMTYKEIGEVFSVSGNRVRQLLKKKYWENKHNGK